MNTIKYELFATDGVAVSANFESGDLTLVFPVGTEGFVRIGARIYKLISSQARFDPAELQDGIHLPKLFTSDGEYPLTAILKNGRSLSLQPPTDDELRTNIIKLKRLEKALISLEKEISALHQKIETTTIF